ncbi:MAG: TetR/AcrR family transcriptional regulator [Gammaproteobacteria bacterium]|nr:TetR/AcrR family transcriptional regulator [Gammaproteobacteria bacterium]
MPYLKKVAPVPEPVDCRILTAALELFVNNGFHNVSVHEIQKQADVSIGSIYNHFGGKEGIAKALYYHLLNEIQDLVDCAKEEKTTAVERCNEIIRQLFHYTETHQSIISFVFHPRHNEFLPDEPPIYNSSPFVAIHEIIQQGMDNNEIRKRDLLVASSAIYGGPIRMINLRLDKVIKDPLPDLLEEILDCIWQGMLVTETENNSKDDIGLHSVG